MSNADGSAKPVKATGGDAVKRAEERVRQLEAKPVGSDLAGIPMAQKLAFVATLVIMGFTWWHALHEMWHRWFPNWRVADLSLTARLTEGKSYYTHGPMVPLACMVIAYLIYRRVGLPSQRTRGSTIVGALVLAGGLLFQIVGARADVTFVAGFAWVAVWAGLVILWGGWAMARAYWLPVVFLLFMVPLPMSAIADISFQLKSIAGRAAVWLTDNVFGVTTSLKGSNVTMVAMGPDGEMITRSLTIDDVCSGLRSLISLICFASLFALVCRVKGWWRIIMLLLAPPVAVVTNIIRITMLNLSSVHISPESAAPGGWVHDFGGLAVFALALAILFGVEALIIKVGKWLNRDWSDPRLMGYLDHLPKVEGQRPRVLRPVVMTAMVGVACLSTYWAVEAEGQHINDMAAQAVSPKVTIMGKEYDSVVLETDELTKRILQTDDIMSRRYMVDGNEKEPVDLTIVFSANNRKGTHPPEVCFKGSGARIVDKRLNELTFTSLRDGQELTKTIDLRELFTEHGRRKSLHLYTYKSGDSYTTSFFRQQATIFINGFIARDTAGALIRIDVPIKGGDIESARAKAMDAAKVFMAQIDEKLGRIDRAAETTASAP